MSALLRGAWQALLVLLGLAALAPSRVYGAFINFDNCLDPNIINSKPQQLQFTPLYFDAKFNRSAPGYPLNVTIYGNVSGQQVEGQYPPPNDPSWSNPNDTFGKISDVGSANKYATLFADFNVVTYTAYDAPSQRFCPTLVNGTCPLAPAFFANESDPYTLPAISVAHDFGGSYAFSTLAGTVRVISGDRGAPDVACISANITPDLGPSIAGLLCWLPAAILILKGIATLAAAIWSPWGSADIFRWSSNYGRDEDQLRLVTPGFGDCLQYIQFVTLTGALSLQYPGYYQPAVSQTSWSLLLFNHSYVSHGNGTQNPIDGVYKYNGTYGMTAMSQLIGMDSVEDIWACMAIWLLVIAAVVVAMCELGFFSRFLFHKLTNTQEEDLRSKNLPFTLGNMIRLLFNYFILPIVAISLFQLVIASRAPISVVVMAVILLVVMIVGGGWILRVIFTTKPRTILFDDMPTVLLYGPLYNTYSDSAAPFALVPVFITFMRAVALGAIQPSGIAQIIVLAICEVILILTLNGFRPFQNQTSMNAYHTFFAVARLITILLSIAFVPTLGVTESSKGWIGYATLLVHACVLVFGFFLNAAQTLIEVIARSLGVAGDAQTGAIRGSILNLRMLKKRRDRPTGDRASMTSDAAILQDTDVRSGYGGGRSRSMSASSQQLLNQAGRGGAPSVNRMSGFDFNGDDYVSSPGAETDNAQSGFSYLPTPNAGIKPALAVKTDADRAEQYYRPPRPRRATNPLDPVTPGVKTRMSGAGDDFPYADSPEPTPLQARQTSYDSVGGFYPGPGRDSPVPAPAYFRSDTRDSGDDHNPHTDYAVREVDQYYRGPALSDQPTRKLKTGPADPEGPAASAQSWFQKMRSGLQGKKQAKPVKGFEVARGRRPPTQEYHAQTIRDDLPDLGEEGMEMQTSPPMNAQRYLDSPELQQQAAGGAERVSEESDGGPVAPEHSERATKGFSFGFDGGNDELDKPDLRPSHDTGVSAMEEGTAYQRSGAPRVDTVSNYDRRPSEASSYHANRASQVPSLGPIQSFGALDMPSRWNSHHSANRGVDTSDTTGGQDWFSGVNNLNWNHNQPLRQPSSSNNRTSAPNVPRRSSRRGPSADMTPGRGQRDVFEGFDSGHASPDFAHEDRPVSFASVGHHRAADSISRNSFGANAHGTSAEFLGRREDDFMREG